MCPAIVLLPSATRKHSCSFSSSRGLCFLTLLLRGFRIIRGQIHFVSDGERKCFLGQSQFSGKDHFISDEERSSLSATPTNSRTSAFCQPQKKVVAYSSSSFSSSSRVQKLMKSSSSSQCLLVVFFFFFFFFARLAKKILPRGLNAWRLPLLHHAT